MTTTQIEAALNKYLVESLEGPHDITVIENINLKSFDGLTKWVVIDTLANSLEPGQPKQLFFLHVSNQNGLKNSNLILAETVDQVLEVVEQGTRIDVYDLVSQVVIGEMEIVEISLSPVYEHRNGGAFRSITIGIAYSGR